MKRKIYDCFSFFNELDLLELRLRELGDVVDHFVLVEATRTHQKKPKPLFFQNNKERYKEFLPKITHVVVDDYPGFFKKFRVPHGLDYDNHQKECITRGIVNAAENDLIIVSDIDEIPLAQKVRENADSDGITVFEQFLCYYYLNYVCKVLTANSNPSLNKNGWGYWRGSVMLPKKRITTIKRTRMLRDSQPSELVKIVENGGWHFSYMGGVDAIIKKLESYCHSEHNTAELKNPDFIKNSIKNGKSLFDESSIFEVQNLETSPLPFPQGLVKNKDLFRNLLLELS